MASYSKFQTDNNKYTNKLSRIDIHNSDFSPQVSLIGNNEKDSFHKNLDKWSKVVAFYRWFPDLFWDLITPKTGGIRLDLDQRVFLRCIARFPTGYYVFPRAYGKTLLEVMGLIHTAIFYPRIKLSLTAQTKGKAGQLLQQKFNDLLNFYPLLKEEIYSQKFSSDDVRIEFNNGSTIDVLANSQTTKGERRHRGSIEEDNLVDENIYNDAVKPVFDDPRRTIGRKGKIDPNENNASVNSFTTAGYRGSPAYHRCKKKYEGMLDLDGSFCLGASWKLAAYNGRGKDINEILKDKKTSSPFVFDMNYMSRWTGSGEDGICNVAKLLECRVLEEPDFTNANPETILAIDVAQSDKDKNCQTVISVFEIIRYRNGRIKEIHLPRIIAISGKLNYTQQAIEVKRAKTLYNSSIIVVDNNGLGRGLTAELLKVQTDNLTGEELPCYDTINTEDTPEVPNSDKIVYAYLSQSNDQEAIPILMECIETERIKLLALKDYGDYSYLKESEKIEKMIPFIQTNFLVDEIQNIKLKVFNNGKLGIERATTRLQKDRFTSFMYGLFYIMKFMDSYVAEDATTDLEELMKYIYW